MEVLGFHERLTLWGRVPLPVRDSTAGEFEALPAKEALADAVPLACGVKVKVKGALWPAAMVKGNASPLRTNSEVLTVAEETVTLAPVALRVPVKLLLLPTTTLPKAIVVGVRASWPAAVPEPDREMVRVEFAALETTEMSPPEAPVEVGAKTVPKVTLCPGFRLSGRLNPHTLNPAPLTVA